MKRFLEQADAGRVLLVALIFALVLNAAVSSFVAYEAHETNRHADDARRHSAENNCILWGIAETRPGPERAARVQGCRE